MGVTTVLLGQDGGSPSLRDARRAADSLPDYLDAVARAKPDVNVATLSGHGALRRRAGIDDGTRKPSDAQLARMQEILEQDLHAGAFGLSTGLAYVHGRYVEPRENGRALGRERGCKTVKSSEGAVTIQHKQK